MDMQRGEQSKVQRLDTLRLTKAELGKILDVLDELSMPIAAIHVSMSIDLIKIELDGQADD